MATEQDPFGQPTPLAAPEPSTPWGAALSGQIPVTHSDQSAPEVPGTPIALDGDDGDIIAPVAEPSVDEVFPASSWPRTPTYLDPLTPEAEPAALPPLDSYQALGSIAATNASFSAAGAPTPLGGVPRPAPTQPLVPPPLATDTAPTDPFGDFAGFDQATETLPTYEPASTTASSPPEDRIPTLFEDDDQMPWWRSAVALVAGGVLVMAGLGAGVYLLWLAPGPLELPAPVILATPQSTAPQPIVLGDVTDFVASMPPRTLTHAMTDVQEIRFRDVPLLQVRTVEVVDLTYFDGQDTVVVRALQHYTTDEAIAAFAGYVGEADGVEDLVVGDEVIGEIVTVTTEDGTTIMWRNTTAIFMVSGEGDLAEFVRLFPY